jgi:U5 small nuclear ribonucleoprotein component
MASFEDYDEFGNYIGADLGSDEEEEEVLQQDFRQVPQQPATLEGYDDEPMPPTEGALMEIDGPWWSIFFVCISRSLPEPVHNAVILHEDKQYYPSAEDVYGPDVEALVQEEDAQPLSEPIVAPIKVRKWTVEEKDMPQTRFDKG